MEEDVRHLADLVGCNALEWLLICLDVPLGDNLGVTSFRDLLSVKSLSAQIIVA